MRMAMMALTERPQSFHEWQRESSYMDACASSIAIAAKKFDARRKTAFESIVIVVAHLKVFETFCRRVPADSGHGTIVVLLSHCEYEMLGFPGRLGEAAASSSFAFGAKADRSSAFTHPAMVRVQWSATDNFVFSAFVTSPGKPYVLVVIVQNAGMMPTSSPPCTHRCGHGILTQVDEDSLHMDGAAYTNVSTRLPSRGLALGPYDLFRQRWRNAMIAKSGRGGARR
jgi:hypothetical protein